MRNSIKECVSRHSKAKGWSLRLFLLYLADYSNRTGFAFPTLARMTRETGTSRRTVQRHLRELEALGELRLDREGQGRGKPTHYYVLCGEKGAICDLRGPGRMSPEARRVTSNARKGATSERDSTRNLEPNKPSAGQDLDCPDCLSIQRRTFTPSGLCATHHWETVKEIQKELALSKRVIPVVGDSP